VLALAYLIVGILKVVRPAGALVELGMLWVRDVPLALVKVIGLLEIAGAMGLILPPVTGIAPAIAPISATGLIVVQVAAIITHVVRRELSSIWVNALLLVLAIVVACVGFVVWR
jgi:hypothetical protein